MSGRTLKLIVNVWRALRSFGAAFGVGEDAATRIKDVVRIMDEVRQAVCQDGLQTTAAQVATNSPREVMMVSEVGVVEPVVVMVLVV